VLVPANYVTLSDGKAREVRFTFGTFARLRESTGLRMQDFAIGGRGQTELLDHLPQFIHALLVPSERKAITAAEIAELILPQDLKRIASSVMELWSMVNDEEPANPMEAPPAAGANLSASNGVGPSHDLSLVAAMPNSGT
jgi:hypothetical protein